MGVFSRAVAIHNAQRASTPVQTPQAPRTVTQPARQASTQVGPNIAAILERETTPAGPTSSTARIVVNAMNQSPATVIAGTGKAVGPNIAAILATETAPAGPTVFAMPAPSPVRFTPVAAVAAAPATPTISKLIPVSYALGPTFTFPPSFPAYTWAQLAELWIGEGGDPKQANTAAAVALAESGGRLNALDNTAYPDKPDYHPVAAGNSPEFSVGLWQINWVVHRTYSVDQLFGAADNARAAIAVSDDGRAWGAWSTYNSGAYRRYLAPAGTPLPTLTSLPTKSPAGVGRAWRTLLEQVSINVPKRHSEVQSLATAIRKVAQ